MKNKNSDWDNNNFPKAENPDNVGWMIMYWRITPCSGCKQSYNLESRQFDHLGITATKAEAIIKFNKYVADKKASGKAVSLKGLTLFLTKVVMVKKILDNKGDIING